MKRFLIAIALLMLATTLFLASCTDNQSSSSQNSDPVSGEASVSDNNKDKNNDKNNNDKDSVNNNDKNDNNKNDNDNDNDNNNNNNNDNDSDNNGNNTKPTDPDKPLPEGTIEVLYCTYSEKPYFAMVGRCEDGATVKAECNGETITSESYKGWFSLRLKCTGMSAAVKLSQSRDGEVLSTLNYTAKPRTQSSDMWPVVTGKNFQFFFQKMLPDFEGTKDYPESTYSNLTSKTKTRLNQLRSYNSNAEMIYLVVPSAMTVYPELVPEEYTPASGATRLDKTMNALEKGGATVIDLKELFAKHKNDEMPLYYKLDSHWADYGAFVAYDALFDHISKKFPDAKPRSESEFNWNPDYYESGDMTYYLHMPQSAVKEYAYYRTFDFSVPADILATPRYRSSTMLCYSDQVTWENTIRTHRESLPDITVMRDSYSTQIYDIIAERANTTYYRAMWDYTWDSSVLSYQAPDYVIYIVAEWNLDSIVY